MKKLVKFVWEALASDEYFNEYANNLCRGNGWFPHPLHEWCDNCKPDRDGPDNFVIMAQLNIMDCEWLSEREKLRRVKELFSREDFKRAIQDFIRVHGTREPGPPGCPWSVDDDDVTFCESMERLEIVENQKDEE